jgi:hypothetical protein
MGIRATQEYVAILREGDGGAVRVTQHYLQVLATISTDVPVDATSTLVVTQLAERTGSVNVDAESVLVPAHTATCNIKMGVAESTLALTDEAEDEGSISFAESTIVLTSEAVGTGFRQTASSELTMTVTATAPFQLRKSAQSTIVLTQTAVGHAPFYETAESTLELAQALVVNVVETDAESALVLSDAARVIDEYELSATVTLSLTDEAVGMNLHSYATSALELVHEADSHVKVRSATSTITLTDTAVVEHARLLSSEIELTDLAEQGILYLSAESVLVLDQIARDVDIHVVGETSTIELTDEVTCNIKMLSVEDTIELTDSNNVIRPWRVSAENELTTIEEIFDIDTFTMIEVITGLQDSASYVLDGPREVEHIISFSQVATAQVDLGAFGTETAESTLSLTQEARLSKQVPAETTVIHLIQTATAQVGYSAVSELDTLDVEAEVIVVRTLTAENEIEITHAVSYIFEQSDTLCTYSPFIGTTSDPNAPTPPPATYPAVHGTPGFRLQYPGSGGVTDELLLRAPNLGNRDRLSMVRINRETRGGTLIVFADPIWPKVENLLLSFSGLSADESQDLMTFMETHLGEEIRLIDWEDRLWRGVIVNPQEPVVQDGPGCRYTASFEFEGEKV